VLRAGIEVIDQRKAVTSLTGGRSSPAAEPLQDDHDRLVVVQAHAVGDQMRWG